MDFQSNHPEETVGDDHTLIVQIYKDNVAHQFVLSLSV